MPPAELAEVVSRLRALASAGVGVVDEPTGKDLLRVLGVLVPEGRAVASPDEATAAGGELGWPVGLKIVVPGLVHKSDVGGVAGPLCSPGAVRQAAAVMLNRLDGTLRVEAWAADGVDCFVGLSLRGPLGPVVSVGLGGIWVEALRDVAHRAAPVSPQEAEEALTSLRGVALLRGGRGHATVDLVALAESVALISRLALVPEVREVVSEMDVNPLRLCASGAPIALDCTIVLAPSPPCGVEGDSFVGAAA